MNLTCLFLFRLVYGGLTEMSPEGKLIPRLATSWEGSPDAKVWTFHLRKGVKFHNGEPFNAQAVKYTIDRIVNSPEIIAHQFFTKVKETKVVRITGLNMPVDVFRCPNEMEIGDFDSVWNRAAVMEPSPIRMRANHSKIRVQTHF